MRAFVLAMALGCWDATVVRLDRLCISVPEAERSTPADPELLSWAPRIAALVPPGSRAQIDYSVWESACGSPPTFAGEADRGEVFWVRVCRGDGCASTRTAGRSLEAAFSTVAYLTGASATARARAVALDRKPYWVDAEAGPKESPAQLAEVWGELRPGFLTFERHPGRTDFASFDGRTVTLGPYLHESLASEVAHWLEGKWGRKATVRR